MSKKHVGKTKNVSKERIYCQINSQPVYSIRVQSKTEGQMKKKLPRMEVNAL